MGKAQKGIHKDDIQLETPKVNTTEISELPRKIKLEIPIEQSKSKLHPKQKKVLTSRAVRRANPTGLVKREICRPPSKPPDRQNSLNHKHKTKKGSVKPYENKKETQYIQNADEEGIDAQKIDKELNYRPPSKATLHTRCQWRSNRNN